MPGGGYSAGGNPRFDESGHGRPPVSGPGCMVNARGRWVRPHWVKPRKPSAGHWSARGHRLNPLNPRALRKALRRAKGFERFAKRVMHFTSRTRRPHGFKFRRKKAA
jgi:hypothetical protein